MNSISIFNYYLKASLIAIYYYNFKKNGFVIDYYYLLVFNINQLVSLFIIFKILSFLYSLSIN